MLRGSPRLLNITRPQWRTECDIAAVDLQPEYSAFTASRGPHSTWHRLSWTRCRTGRYIFAVLGSQPKRNPSPRRVDSFSPRASPRIFKKTRSRCRADIVAVLDSQAGLNSFTVSRGPHSTEHRLSWTGRRAGRYISAVSGSQPKRNLSSRRVDSFSPRASPRISKVSRSQCSTGWDAVMVLDS